MLSVIIVKTKYLVQDTSVGKSAIFFRDSTDHFAFFYQICENQFLQYVLKTLSLFFHCIVIFSTNQKQNEILFLFQCESKFPYTKYTYKYYFLLISFFNIFEIFIFQFFQNFYYFSSFQMKYYEFFVDFDFPPGNWKKVNPFRVLR